MADLERRIRAAQQLGGFQSLDDLAAAIGRESEGLSRKTLRRIAADNDPRRAKDYELAWIAEACGVPITFFDLDAGPAPPSQLDRLEQTVTEIARREEAASEEREVILGLLARQDSILSEIQRVVAGMPADETLQMLNQAALQLEAAQAAREARAAQTAIRDETHRRRVGD